jgi:uncharacterized membrane protein
MKRALTFGTILIALSVPHTLWAKPDFMEGYLSHFKSFAGQADKGCAGCHVSSSDFKLNLYGKQLAQELHRANAKQLSEAILVKVDALDADGDGATNIEELKAGTNPTDPKNGGNPAAVKTSGAQPTTTETEPEEPPKKPLVPKNAYHPAIVHFPIALFIAGLLLDLIGYWKKKDGFLQAGWYNLVFAAVTCFGALLSGYVATLLMHLPITGIIKQHVITAVAGTAIMWIMVALRARRHKQMSLKLRVAYYFVAIVGLVLVSYSGHLGGVFVYGE